ncbi:DUF6126 family protein [Streptomyces sp. NPDC004609]|uniref:DUF6126 family protein n=1 Tax=Streptomyces sp. NPDC004609 TaxID=3364704 RepID=UPI00368D2DD0
MSETPAVSEGSALPEQQGQTAAGKENGRFPRGIWVRLFAYLIAGHVFAGFLYLLFEVGSK